MLRRLRRRRSLWAAIAAGIVAVPALFGGVAAAPANSGDQLPPPDRNPRETLPPDPVQIEAMLALTQMQSIADLAPEEFRSRVVAAANRHRLDPRLLAAIITVETRWDPHVVGIYGELGLMQLLPSTGAFLAKEAGLVNYDLADTATNLELGATYLASLLSEYGTPEKALAAYNGGPTAVDNATTNLYARKVLKVYYKQQVPPASVGVRELVS